ncbi:MAG: O-antigen ligase family protein [Pyrinomonadaceae bacterium]
MPSDRLKREDYKPLTPSSRAGFAENKNNGGDVQPKHGTSRGVESHVKKEVFDGNSLVNPRKNNLKNLDVPKSAFDIHGNRIGAEVAPKKRKDAPKPGEPNTTNLHQANANQNPLVDDVKASPPNDEISRNSLKQAKMAAARKRFDKDQRALNEEHWLVKHGHNLTYWGVFLFTFMTLVRPYETIPGMGFTKSITYYVAIATLAIYVPTQFSTEGNLSVLTTEVKCILGITLLGLLTIVLAADKGLAWETFNDPFIKAVLIFIVMVNVVRTRARLNGLMALSIFIAAYLAIDAYGKFQRGEFMTGTDEARVAIDIGGMFGNPNDMSLYMVTIFPLALTLGLATKNKFVKIVLLIVSGMMVFTVLVTQSRGGFLGILAVGAVLAWKLGRSHRVNVTILSIVVAFLVILVAPGNTGKRILSIFIPGLDASGSRSQRSDLLERSIFVTLRNPWGLGMSNFKFKSIHDLESHNAYTQISTELGLLGLLLYLIFLINPLRKLGAIERTLFAKGEGGWLYLLSIGLQASIIGYMVSSFFASVAYNWFMYYIIAYAVCFRRIYMTEKGVKENEKLGPGFRESLRIGITKAEA